MSTKTLLDVLYNKTKTIGREGGGKNHISIIIAGTVEPRKSLDYGNSTGKVILTIPSAHGRQLIQNTLESYTKYKQLALQIRPICNFAFLSKFLKDS